MPMFKIRDRHTGSVLFKMRCDRLRTAVEAAVRSGVHLSDANLSGANLLYADLRGADLTGANLRRADLWHADLSLARLKDADLGDADLSRVNLGGANLIRASLSRASLIGADLGDADLSHAHLDGANLSHARGIIDAGYPNGWRCIGCCRNGTIQVHVGCRVFTLAEGRAYWAGKDNRREVLAALDYIETVAAIRNWPVTGGAASVTASPAAQEKGTHPGDAEFYVRAGGRWWRWRALDAAFKFGRI